MSQQPLARNENPSNSPAKQHSPLARFTAVLGTFFSLIAVFWIATLSPAYAKSVSTSFKDAVAASETIAIVRLVELRPSIFTLGRVRSKATLDVLQVLKGKLQLGKQQVEFEDDPSRAPGEFVAFLDKDRVWRFTARPLKGKRVEADVLEMEGFSDDDGDFVSPGLVTLEQLKTYLKDGTLRYSMEGPIWFPQRGRPTWKASGLRIKLTYDAVKDQARVTGLPKLAGFPADPVVWIGGFPRHVSLKYSDDSVRPFKLEGQVESLDRKSGSILARFVVTSPDVLNQEILEKYLGDRRLGRTSYKCRLHCAPCPQYPKLKDLVLDLDRDDTPFNFEGWDGGPLAILGSKYTDADQSITARINQPIPAEVAKPFAGDWVLRMLAQTETNQYLMLAFDVGKPKESPDLLRWTFRKDLLYNVYSAPVQGTLQLYDGKTWQRVTTFTVDLEPVQFGSAR